MSLIVRISSERDGALMSFPWPATDSRFIHIVRHRGPVVGLPAGLRLRFYPGVPADVRKELKGFARWLRNHIGFSHAVIATISHKPAVPGPGWASFWAPDNWQPGDALRIYVGGGIVDFLQHVHEVPRKKALQAVCENLAHEIVHYEQWRDGRDLTERGVNLRAANLYRKWKRSKS